ncbi:related to F-LANa protein [Rhynchosporium secalis]|uniref:Derlin n=1 Tax=Rhynchosporium secalis TaxID=38038 RepID=A0A1E1LXR2_RHYSE|nr:related to F-LANa protein [Rhynchosporium secalis]
MWLIEAFFNAPPISRTLATTSFVFSLLLYTGVLNYSLFFLSLSRLIQLPPEIWRLVTSLLITGGGLSLLFDVYFLFVYGCKLEIASPRFSQRADYATYLGFVCGTILTLNLIPTVSGHALASPLAMSLITTCVRDTWDVPITLFIVTMPCQYLPYAFLLLTLVLSGPQAALIQATGLAAAHLYDLLSGIYPSSGIENSYIQTPKWMTKICGTQDVVVRPYGTASSMGVPTKKAWGIDLSWKRFGPGRTLGGEGEGEGEDETRLKGLMLAAIVMGCFLVVCAVLGYKFVYGLPWWVSGVEGGQITGTTHTGEGKDIP